MNLSFEDSVYSAIEDIDDLVNIFRDYMKEIFLEEGEALIQSIKIFLESSNRLEQRFESCILIASNFRLAASLGYSSVDFLSRYIVSKNCKVFESNGGWERLGIYLINLIDQKREFLHQFEVTFSDLLNSEKVAGVVSEGVMNIVDMTVFMRVLEICANYSINLSPDDLMGVINKNKENLINFNLDYSLENMLILTWLGVNNIQIDIFDLANWRTVLYNEVCITPIQGKISLCHCGCLASVNASINTDISEEYARFSRLRIDYYPDGIRYESFPSFVDGTQPNP